MRAVFDKIIVVDESAPERTASGLHLPGTSDASMVIRGRIVELGEEVSTLFKKDDVVMYNRHSAFPFEKDGVKYRVLPVKEILAVI